MSQVTPEALTFYERAQGILENLYVRWESERRYENIDLYLLPLNGLAGAVGVQLLAMTKKPFGVKYRVGEKVFHAFIRHGEYSYKRIK